MQARLRVGRTVLPALVALGIGLVLPLAALAHGGGTEPTVELDPQQVTAGGTVVIVGQNMEPNTDRVVVMVGQQLIVQFGTVKTDADGMFTLQVTVPSHLPGGVYQVQAIGDETISADLEVIAAAGMPSAAPVAQEQVRPRHVEGVGLVLLVAVTGLLALGGGWLVVSAERLAGHHGA
jgi:hypothetical protein